MEEGNAKIEYFMFESYDAGISYVKTKMCEDLKRLRSIGRQFDLDGDRRWVITDQNEKPLYFCKWIAATISNTIKLDAKLVTLDRFVIKIFNEMLKENKGIKAEKD